MPTIIRNSKAIPHHAKTGKLDCDSAVEIDPTRAMTHPI